MQCTARSTLDKPIVPLFKGQYDLRVVVAFLKKMLGKETITKDDLPPIDQLLEGLNSIPEVEELFPEIEENK